MLCWLREDEMSVQELLQRVQCVITHVGKSFIFVLLFFSPPHLSLHISHFQLERGELVSSVETCPRELASLLVSCMVEAVLLGCFIFLFFFWASWLKM